MKKVKKIYDKNLFEFRFTFNVGLNNQKKINNHLFDRKLTKPLIWYEDLHAILLNEILVGTLRTN